MASLGFFDNLCDVIPPYIASGPTSETELEAKRLAKEKELRRDATLQYGGETAYQRPFVETTQSSSVPDLRPFSS